MVRAARQISDSGFYHIMTRGVNKQPIFENSDDYKRFIDILVVCKQLDDIKIHAFCLMENHVHFLIEDPESRYTSTLFRRVGGRYVTWFNKKYGRTGPLFQDRYKSEAIENDAYLLSCVRYIIQNPVNAGLCSSPFDYPYSSAKEYIGSNLGITDTSLILNMVDRNDIVNFLSEKPSMPHIDIEKEKMHLTDNDLRNIMKRLTNCTTSSDFQKLTKDKRNDALSALRKAGGSIRQISRLTGIGENIVRNCK